MEETALWCWRDGGGLKSIGRWMLLPLENVGVLLLAVERTDALEKVRHKSKGFAFSAISLEDHGFFDAVGLPVLDFVPLLLPLVEDGGRCIWYQY